VFSPSQLLQTDRMRELMFERALNMLTRQADEQRFMLFPLGMLAGGAVVAPRA
jgi:hypothetical protein